MIQRVHGGGVSLIADQAGCHDRSAKKTWTAYLADDAGQFEVAVNVEAQEKSLGFNFDGHAERLAAFLTKHVSETTAKVYCRVAPRSDPFTVEAQEKVIELGRSFPHPPFSVLSRDFAKPKIETLPALYSYLGQFIAHEVSNLGVLDADARLTELRTGAIDLDSLFDAPENDAESGQIWAGGVGVGQTDHSGGQHKYEDLPRRKDGSPLIADARNDDNLLLAQLHLGLSKFHQIVFRKVAGRNPIEAKRVTRQHVHSIVLHDYLRRLIDPWTYADVLKNGRKVIYPGPLGDRAAFIVPIEFSAACLRIGHSMVGEVYGGWQPGIDTLRQIENLKRSSRGERLSDEHRLDDGWQMPWDAMLGDSGERGTSRNAASAIDTLLANVLDDLPDSHVPKSAFAPSGKQIKSLSALTLLRGMQYRIPGAQTVLSHVNGVLEADGVQPIRQLTDPELLAFPQFDDLPQPGLRTRIKSDGWLHNTPLWLYCLAEARHQRSGCGMGPLASRIVMETIHAAIEASDDSIISEGRTVTFQVDPTLGNGATYDLQQLSEVVAGWSATDFEST